MGNSFAITSKWTDTVWSKSKQAMVDVNKGRFLATGKLLQVRQGVTASATPYADVALEVGEEQPRIVRFFNSKNNPNVLLTLEALKKGAILEISGMVDFFPGKEKLTAFNVDCPRQPKAAPLPA